MLCLLAGCSDNKPDEIIRPLSTGKIPIGVSDQVHLMDADPGKLPGSFQKGLVMLYRRDLPGLLFIVNARGEIVWYQHADSTGYKVASYTSRHTILALMAPLRYPTSYGDEIVETKLNGDTVLHFKKGEKGFDKTIHHELFYNNAGQLVTLTLDQRVVDLSKAGGSRADTVRGDGILVLDKNGNKIWEWSVFDVLDPAGYPGILQEKNDWLHANSLSIDRDGNYIVSFYLGRQIWKIDARTGKLLWRLGKNGDFTLRRGVWFTESHTVYRNNNNELVLFENGTSDKRSAVLVYEIDEAGRQASLKTKVPLPENLYSQRMGSAYAMGDSTWLVSAAQSGNVVVTDEKGAILWRLKTGFIPYRAAFIPVADQNRLFEVQPSIEK